MALTLRLVKGTPLTHAEGDDNFSGLADGSNWAAIVTAALTALTIGSLTVGSGPTQSILSPSSLLIGEAATTQTVAIELGRNRTGDGIAHIDFHGHPGVDRDSRIIRASGVNGALTIENNGTGDFILSTDAGSVTINGASALVTVPNSLTVPQILTVGDGDLADGDTLLIFNTERAWRFKQVNDGASTELALKSDVDGKFFSIQNSASVTNFKFLASTTGPNFTIYDLNGVNSALLFHDGTNFRTTFTGTTQWTITGAVAITGNTTLGDTSGDTLTINAGTWTIGSNYTATRAAGTVATGQIELQKFTSSFTGDAGGASDVRSLTLVGAPSGGNAIQQAIGVTGQLNNTATATISSATAVNGFLSITSTGNITTAAGFSSQLFLSNSGSITTGLCYRAITPTLSSTGSITTLKGFSSGNMGHATLVTNAFGFDADDCTAALTLTAAFRSQMTSGTGKWGFYASGTANNAFAGNVRIGSTVAPTVALDVTGGITVSGNLTLTSAASQIIPGATSFAVRNNANSADNLLISNAGAVTIRDDLAVNGNTISTDDTVFALLNTTVTTLNFAGAATVLNIGNISGNVFFKGATIPQNTQNGAYTLVAGDANSHINHTSATAHTYTIPANSSVAYAVGTAVTFRNGNGAGVLSIAITTDTMRLAGPGTTGTRSLAANGIATALKVAATEWVISGTGLT